MRRVLLIEDKPEIRNRISRKLQRYGYETTGAGDGAEGLEKILGRDRDYDCVVSDINMPGMDGRELLTRLRRLRNDLPLISISLHRAWQPSARAEGAWGFWGKLENPGRLAREIEGVTRKARAVSRQRKAPRRNIEGKAIFRLADLEHPISGRIFNVSQRGLMFAIAGEYRLADAFGMECVFAQSRIVIERLCRDWKSIDGAGKLIGARIEKISPQQNSLLKDLCSSAGALAVAGKPEPSRHL